MDWLKRLSVITVLLLGLAACGNPDTTNQSENSDSANEAVEEVTISLTITDQTTDTVIGDEEYTVEEGTDLLTVIEENYDQVEVTDDGFLTSIEGHQQDVDNNIYWLYQVNGEDGTVGMAEYEAREQDKISINLQSLE
ncbi:DUF4430 domain-containing protein [Gracilibacillus alcaliphilus]|uniref:DUF4430 domain-containing protein n=1 Tax=Gracilibacillus alcaliphilus TaxID=1401441 RepID=UPI00195BCE0B|nr:DUF4430 domain-containing protein [Gracilibacillus alcaliphilus]MBM7675157.1 hypothetical protein [Gracilibacillus alcaliphilus]